MLSYTPPHQKKKKVLAICHPKEAWPGLSGALWVGTQSPKASITDSGCCAPRRPEPPCFLEHEPHHETTGGDGGCTISSLKCTMAFRGWKRDWGAPTLADSQSRAGQGQALKLERSSPSIPAARPLPFSSPEPSLLLSPAWACCLYLPQTFPTSSSRKVAKLPRCPRQEEKRTRSSHIWGWQVEARPMNLGIPVGSPK